jgi:IS30 family transposase
MSNEYTHIDKDERNEIKAMLEKGYTQADIARAIDRSRSTISREINRNKVNGVYIPNKADHRAYVRRKKASFRGKKIAMDPDLQRFVEDKLNTGWSPELISGRLGQVREDLPDVGKDTIYRYLDSVHGNKVDYRVDTQRTKRNQRKHTLDDRTFIDERPDIADTRGRIGDWEMDFVESGKSSTAVLLVLVERLSRYTVARKLPNRSFAAVHKAVADAVRDKHVVSITTDNDIAFRKHEKIAAAVEAAIYFCHPYCSWEKGSVEQVNKLLRSWIPKGSDISEYKNDRIQAILDKLNNRPRKCLEYYTPNEVMETYQQIKEIDIGRDTLLKKVADCCV